MYSPKPERATPQSESCSPWIVPWMDSCSLHSWVVRVNWAFSWSIKKHRLRHSHHKGVSVLWRLSNFLKHCHLALPTCSMEYYVSILTLVSLQDSHNPHCQVPVFCQNPRVSLLTFGTNTASCTTGSIPGYQRPLTKSLGEAWLVHLKNCCFYKTQV